MKIVFKLVEVLGAFPASKYINADGSEAIGKIKATVKVMDKTTKEEGVFRVSTTNIDALIDGEGKDVVLDIGQMKTDDGLKTYISHGESAKRDKEALRAKAKAEPQVFKPRVEEKKKKGFSIKS